MCSRGHAHQPCGASACPTLWGVPHGETQSVLAGRGEVGNDRVAVAQCSPARSRSSCCTPPTGLQVVALENVNSVEAAFIYTLEPVAGAALAYFWLGERWGPSGWLGALLIVGSCLVTQLCGAYEEHHSYKAAAVAQAEDPEEE